jgi:hypothetical protein
MPTSVIPTPEELTAEEQINLAKALATRMAYDPADVDDLSQEALLKYIRSNRAHAHKPFPFARTVMQRAIVSYYRSQKLRPPHLSMSALSTEQLRQVSHSNVFAAIEDKALLEQYLLAVESGMGPLARRAAENLINPKDPNYCKRIIKKTHRKKIRRTVNGSPLQLRRALGLKNRTQWAKLIRELREFTHLWLTLPNTAEDREGNHIDSGVEL